MAANHRTGCCAMCCGMVCAIGDTPMKKHMIRLLAALITLSALQGCAGIKEESAMEWMARQPWSTIP